MANNHIALGQPIGSKLPFNWFEHCTETYAKPDGSDNCAAFRVGLTQGKVNKELGHLFDAFYKNNMIPEVTVKMGSVSFQYADTFIADLQPKGPRLSMVIAYDSVK